MNLQEIISAPVIENESGNEFEPLAGTYFNHVPEAVDNGFELCNAHSERIQIKCHAFMREDHRRFWKLCSVWLDDVAVMVIRNAGREGDDHTSRWVINAEMYPALIEEIRKSLPCKEIRVTEISTKEDLGDICDFYGQKLLLGEVTPRNFY